jgi:hypothetical protein
MSKNLERGDAESATVHQRREQRAASGREVFRGSAVRFGYGARCSYSGLAFSWKVVLGCCDSVGS